MKIKYIVTYGGGIGPNTWDGEMVVEANSIREALDIAEPKIQKEGGQVSSIEESD